MRRMFVKPMQLEQNPLHLTPAQSRYLSVLRLTPGALLEIFDGEGGRWQAELLFSDQLRLMRELPEVHGHCDVVLAQSLAKGDKLEVVIQKATELGATRVVPLSSERAVVKLDEERALNRTERWRKIAQEAARQCGRGDVPQVDAPVDWEELFAILRAEPERRALLLDPWESALRLSAAARGAPSLLLAVGPEGGFAPHERDRALAEGFLSVTLGPLVLRTETAGLAALAVVRHLNGELG